MYLLFIFWGLALSGLCFVLVRSLQILSDKICLLRNSIYLHDDKIVQLSNELEMCRIYLRDHCMFCMYDMDPDRKEENKE